MNEEPTFYQFWSRVNSEFQSGRLPGLCYQARPGWKPKARTRPTRNQNPLHPFDCQCTPCRFLRAEAKLAARDFVEEARRQARARIFEEEAGGWVKGILVDE